MEVLITENKVIYKKDKSPEKKVATLGVVTPQFHGVGEILVLFLYVSWEFVVLAVDPRPCTISRGEDLFDCTIAPTVRASQTLVCDV